MFFTDKQRRQLQQIKSQICLRTDLDTGLNCIRVKGEDGSGNEVSGAQIVLQQMNYETGQIKRMGYLVTSIELSVTPIDVISSKIILEWNNIEKPDVEENDSEGEA